MAHDFFFTTGIRIILVTFGKVSSKNVFMKKYQNIDFSKKQFFLFISLPMGFISLSNFRTLFFWLAEGGTLSFLFSIETSEAR